MCAVMPNLEFPGPEPPFLERRQFVRQDLSSSLAYVDLGFDNGGLLLNISEGGICVQAAMALLGQEVPVLRFQVRGSGPWIEANGRLAWVGETKKVAGVSFSNLFKAARQQIREWMNSETSPPIIEKQQGSELEDETSSATTVQERRTHPRQQVADALAYVELGQDNGGIVLDISEDGIAVQTAMPLISESFPAIRFQMRGGGPWIEVSGRLAWIGDTRKVAGIAFTDLSESTRARIRDWVAFETSPHQNQTEKRPNAAPAARELPSLDSVTELMRPDQFVTEAALQNEPAAKESSLIGKYDQSLDDFGAIPTFRIPAPLISRATWRKRNEYAASRLRRISSRLQSKRVVVSRVALLTAAAFAIGILIGHAGLNRVARARHATQNDNGNIAAQKQSATTGTGSSNGTLDPEENNRLSAQLEQLSKPKSDLTPPTFLPPATEQPTPSLSSGMDDKLLLKPPAKKQLTARRNAVSPMRTSHPIAPRRNPTFAKNESPVTPLGRKQDQPVQAQSRDKIPSALARSPATTPALTTPQKPSELSRAQASLPADAAPEAKPAQLPENPGTASSQTAPQSSTSNQSQSTMAQSVQASAQLDACQLVHYVQPVYPRNAQRQHIEGTVRLRIVVGTDGTVRNVKLVSGPPLLVAAAETAAHDFRYIPAFLNGRPIETIQTVDMLFQLKH